MIDTPVLVKDALRDGSYKKNYRIIVYKEDGYTQDFIIENDHLVSESVGITERMCSDKEIKFGLCEGTSLEFQCFDVQNITGRRIKVYLDCQYKDEHGELMWYPITIGWFTVDECSRQASTGILKVQCYNKLLGDYLDQKANTLLADNFVDDKTITIFDIQKTLLGDYQIKQNYEKLGAQKWPSGTIISSSAEVISELSLKFSQCYGINNPLNYCMLRDYGGPSDPTITPNDAFQFYSKAKKKERTMIKQQGSIYVPTTYWDYFLADMMENYGTLEEQELAFRDQLASIVDGAMLTDSNGNAISGNDLIDSLCANNQWKHIFSIVLQVQINSGSTISIVDKVFSTVQYEYNKSHNISTENVRPINEVLKTMTPRILSQNSYLYTIYAYKAEAYGLYHVDSFDRMYLYHVGYWPDATLSYPFYYYYVTDFPYTKSDPIDAPVLYYKTGQMYTSNPNVEFYGAMEEDIAEANKISYKISEIPEFTLRDITNAVYETLAQFGRLDRESDLFSGIELNHSRLLPADDLYPANDLYPMSVSERSNKSMYSKLWADEGNVHTFRYLIIIYKALESSGGQTVEVEKVLQRTINENGTDNYNMSDNWLFRNLVWTSEQVGAYADAMVEKMRDLKWFPFEMWCTGLPYIEVGDELEINIGENAYITYLLTRKIKGIQNLQDEMINGKLNIF